MKLDWRAWVIICAGFLMQGFVNGFFVLQHHKLQAEVERAHERLSICEEVKGFSNAEGPPTKPNLWWNK